jgi:hypothetical protein
MTSHRFLPSFRKTPARASIAVLILVTAALGIAVVSACGASDDPTPNNFIGVTDASPPRLGSNSPDGGAAR